jgi:hypothetical protein
LEKPNPVNIILSVDLMSFTGLIFVTTATRNIRFVTTTLIQDRKKNTIMSALNQVIKIYHGKGHVVQDMEFEETERHIHTLLAVDEFQDLKDDLAEMGMNVHVVTKNKHAPEIERQNWVIKERACGMIQTLPYRKIPKKMRIALIQYVFFWLNTIPKEGQN